MKPRIRVLALTIGAFCAGSALAQTAGTEVERNVNQQQRIEQGLQSGQLNTREAAKLEAGEARINRMNGNTLHDGTLTPAEKARIDRAQNTESAAIHREKHDAQHGNPESASSHRIQAAARRNINQQQRIAHGVATGTLTNTETGKLERGQAHVERMEAHAGSDGHVGPAGAAAIQHAENVQSAKIYRKKHNAAAE
jgi:hypothetical protein